MRCFRYTSSCKESRIYCIPNPYLNCETVQVVGKQNENNRTGKIDSDSNHNATAIFKCNKNHWKIGEQ